MISEFTGFTGINCIYVDTSFTKNPLFFLLEGIKSNFDNNSINWVNCNLLTQKYMDGPEKDPMAINKIRCLHLNFVKSQIAK